MWLNYKLKKCNAIEIGWEVPTVTSIEHLDARSGCSRLPNSETLVPVWRTDSADAKAVLHTGTNASAFCTSWPPKNQDIHEFGMKVWCFQGSWPHKNHAPRGGNSLCLVKQCLINIIYFFFLYIYIYVLFIYGNRFQPDPIKQWNIFPKKM